MTFCLQLSCFFCYKVSLRPAEGEKNCVEVKKNCVVSPLHGRDMLSFCFVLKLESQTRSKQTPRP